MVKKNLSTTQINSDLTKLKINESHIQMFCQKWESNITGLYSALLTSNQRGCKLVNMDWKFGVTASSSEFQQVGNCFLQVAHGFCYCILLIRYSPDLDCQKIGTKISTSLQKKLVQIGQLHIIFFVFDV